MKHINCPTEAITNICIVCFNMVLRKCEAKQPNYQGKTDSYFLLATGSTSRRVTIGLLNR